MSPSASPTLESFHVRCPSCTSEYPVDPERVPLEGILAVCSSCMRAFPVELPDELTRAIEERLGGPAEKPSSAMVDAPPEPAPPDPEPVAPPPEPAPPAEGPTDSPTETAPPRQEPQEPDLAIHDLRGLAEEALAEDEAEAEPAPAGEAALSRGLARFGRRDPHERARRLARVLVSDIIAYFPEKHAEAVERGTVKEEFEDEVQKSRKEYVDQVGHEIAESTDYFREALNEVLARGREVY